MNVSVFVWSWGEEEGNWRGDLDLHHVSEERPPPAERWTTPAALETHGSLPHKQNHTMIVNIIFDWLSCVFQCLRGIRATVPTTWRRASGRRWRETWRSPSSLWVRPTRNMSDWSFNGDNQTLVDWPFKRTGELKVCLLSLHSWVFWEQTAVLRQQTQWSHEGKFLFYQVKTWDLGTDRLVFKTWGQADLFLRPEDRPTPSCDQLIPETWGQTKSFPSLTGRWNWLVLKLVLHVDICFLSQSKGAKEKVVTRIMVSRCEVDLMKIRTEFKRQHKRSLYQTIAVSTSLWGRPDPW